MRFCVPSRSATSARKAARLALPLLLATCIAGAQEEQHRGRKYQPPPPVAHVTITVTKATNGKPLESASVIFHTFHNGKDQGNLEMKTNEEGQAVIDVLPIGDTVRLQVIKSGFQTYGEDYVVDTAVKEIDVKLKRPVDQYSTYDKKEGRSPTAPPVPPNQ